MRILSLLQQMPGGAPQQPVEVYGQQQQVPQQPMQQQVQGQSGAPVDVYNSQGTNADMKQVLLWSLIAGAACGGVQALASLVNGFNIIDILMSLGIASVIGIMVAIIIGSVGKKIPIQAKLMVKLAAFMFVINIIVSLFLIGLGSGFVMILGIIAIGIGSFLYGYLLEKKVPNLE